jgi:hypothetical protein
MTCEKGVFPIYVPITKNLPYIDAIDAENAVELAEINRPKGFLWDN